MTATKSTKLRWQLVAIIYLTSLFYLLFQGGKTAMMLFMILNLLLFYLVLGRWSGINKVSGSRSYTALGATALNQSLSAGSSLDVSLHVKIPGYYPLPYVIVRDQLQRHNGQKVAFETLLRAQLETQRPCNLSNASIAARGIPVYEYTMLIVRCIRLVRAFG